MKRSKAFTLIELLAVIVILGVLIAITTVSVNGIRKKQEAENRRNAFSSILTGAKAYVAEHPEVLNRNMGASAIEIGVVSIIQDNYADIDENKYPELIWNNGIKANGQRLVKVGLCSGDTTKTRLYYALYDKADDVKKLNYADTSKISGDVQYNDCGCEEQVGGVDSDKICYGNNGKNNSTAASNAPY